MFPSHSQVLQIPSPLEFLRHLNNCQFNYRPSSIVYRCFICVNLSPLDKLPDDKWCEELDFKSIPFSPSLHLRKKKKKSWAYYGTQHRMTGSQNFLDLEESWIYEGTLFIRWRTWSSITYWDDCTSNSQTLPVNSKYTHTFLIHLPSQVCNQMATISYNRIKQYNFELTSDQPKRDLKILFPSCFRQDSWDFWMLVCCCLLKRFLPYKRKGKATRFD